MAVMMKLEKKMRHTGARDSITILHTLAERAGSQFQLFTTCIYRQVKQIVCIVAVQFESALKVLRN